jgi:hypothetical protein
LRREAREACFDHFATEPQWKQTAARRAAAASYIRPKLLLLTNKLKLPRSRHPRERADSKRVARVRILMLHQQQHQSGINGHFELLYLWVSQNSGGFNC